MESKDLIGQLGISTSLLDEKKEQTTKKIAYVTTYIENWLYVWVNRPETTTITFIDAMCNAGIYKDGDLGTATEACRLFCSFAVKHPSINFKLYLNDCSKERLEACVSICEHIIPDKCSNILIMYANRDVNDFLKEASETDKVPKGYGNAVLLFVDPYNAGTVHISRMAQFIKSRYCEVIFNWFSSDVVRNKGDKRILDCFIDLEDVEGKNPDDIVSAALRIGRMRYVFSYPFRNANNTKLYRIIFVTPNDAGLAKMKDALWDTFGGAQYHRNARCGEFEQPRLFDDDSMANMQADAYAREAQELLLTYYNEAAAVSYEQIRIFLLERTMMKDGQFIDRVLKPLVKAGKVRKDGKASSRNFKEDSYSFI